MRTNLQKMDCDTKNEPPYLATTPYHPNKIKKHK